MAAAKPVGLVDDGAAGIGVHRECAGVDHPGHRGPDGSGEHVVGAIDVDAPTLVWRSAAESVPPGDVEQPVGARAQRVQAGAVAEITPSQRYTAIRESRGPRRIADERDDVVAGFTKQPREGTAHETGGAGERISHRVIQAGGTATLRSTARRTLARSSAGPHRS